MFENLKTNYARCEPKVNIFICVTRLIISKTKTKINLQLY